jgi:hypothetical protein
MAHSTKWPTTTRSADLLRSTLDEADWAENHLEGAQLDSRQADWSLGRGGQSAQAQVVLRELPGRRQFTYRAQT